MSQFHEHNQMMSCWIVRYLRSHSGWNGNIMALDHPKMTLGDYRDEIHERKSVPGWIHVQKITFFPSKPRIINFIATILKILELQDYLVLAVVLRELSQAPVCFLFDCCIFNVRFSSLSCYSSAKTRI